MKILKDMSFDERTKLTNNVMQRFCMTNIYKAALDKEHAFTMGRIEGNKYSIEEHHHGYSKIRKTWFAKLFLVRCCYSRTEHTLSPDSSPITLELRWQ